MTKKSRPARARLLTACALLLLGGALASGQSAIAQSPAGGAPASNGVGSQFELTFWQSVATSEDRAQYEAYLSQYPAGTFSALARAKIAVLDRAAGQQPAPTAPVSAPAPASVAPAPVSQPATPAVAPAPVAPVTPTTSTEPPAAPLAAAPPSPATPAPPAAPASDPFAKLAAARAARAAPPARPARPAMLAVPAVTLPDRFCSATERNSFHDSVYQTAVAVADQNNKAAVGYMDQLQAENDARSREGDIQAANLIAREAGDYRATAQEAYTVRNDFVGLFDRLMAVPITACR